MPNHLAFLSLDQWLWEVGPCHGIWWDICHPHSVCNVWIEYLILEVTERHPAISTRSLAAWTGASHVIRRTLQEQQLYAYYVQSVEEIISHDAPARCAFCQFILQQLARDRSFTTEVLFTDESCLTRTGITDSHNEHVSSDENPDAIWSHHQQRQFYINLWAEVLDDCLIAPLYFTIRI
jgi:hypothetical protein